MANISEKFSTADVASSIGRYFSRPYRLVRDYDRSLVRADAIAGVTVAVVLLPQAIAFALIAELPPQMGLYTAIVAGIIGALFGSSDQMFTGPANAISLLVLSALSSYFVAGSSEFVLAAGLLAVMAGIFQIGMGLARLGFLVNFVSHSVIVGFASGAGVLIAAKQLDTFLGMEGSGSGLIGSVVYVATHLNEIHLPSAEIGVATIAMLLLLRWLRPSLPGPLIAMVVASLAVFIFDLAGQGVAVIGQIPSTLPPLTAVPVFNLELIARLSTGALAVGAIGLVQVTAITRSISTQTQQRLDSNQEFVGQGLANILSGFFSGYNSAGSFSITAVNFKAGARSPFAAIFASLFVLLAMLALGSLTAYLPRAALAGVLLVTAYGMVDQAEIKRIWASQGYDKIIMIVTLLGTLFLEIEFAVLTGIILSLAFYILRTSTPRVHSVLPDDEFQHFQYQPDKEQCPQLCILEVLGDLYFGAVTHVEEFVLDQIEKYPDQRFLLLRMHNVNHCDFSGVHMLENLVRLFRDRGGDVFLVRPNPRVYEVMKTARFITYLGEENILDEDTAVSELFYRIIDPAVCIYECPVRAFKECQNLPKRVELVNIPTASQMRNANIDVIAPTALWDILHSQNGEDHPDIIDVREPREFRQGHIPQAVLLPLPEILKRNGQLGDDGNRTVVLVCRSGRRSRRAAYAMQQVGITNVKVLDGGMIAWEAAGLLEALTF